MSLLFYSAIPLPSTRGRVCRDFVDKRNLCILVTARGTEQSFPSRYSAHALHMHEHESRVKTSKRNYNQNVMNSSQFLVTQGDAWKDCYFIRRIFFVHMYSLGICLLSYTACLFIRRIHHQAADCGWLQRSYMVTVRVIPWKF